MAEAPLTLDEHLGRGYNYYVRGKLKGWSPTIFGEQLKTDPAMKAEAQTKLKECEAIIRAGRQCFVSSTNIRILKAALEIAAA